MLSYISAICWCQISTYILNDSQFLQINSITRTKQKIITILISLISLGTILGQILKHSLLENGVEVRIRKKKETVNNLKRNVIYNHKVCCCIFYGKKNRLSKFWLQSSQYLHHGYKSRPVKNYH